MLPKLDLELTLEQQFQMQLFEKELATMSRERMESLLLKISETVMVKENIIKLLMNRVTTE